MALARVHLFPLPLQPGNTTHVVPEEHFVWFGQPLSMKAVPWAQKPLPPTVLKQVQLLLPLQWNRLKSLVHLTAQWHLPFSTGAPPFLRHLRRARRPRASALSAKPILESVAPSRLYPAHYIA